MCIFEKKNQYLTLQITENTYGIMLDGMFSPNWLTTGLLQSSQDNNAEEDASEKRKSLLFTIH